MASGTSTSHDSASQPPTTNASEMRDQGNELESISVLLIGRTGNGKSTVGNALLGLEHFKATTGVATCTQFTQSHQVARTRDGRQFNLQVVDLPDLWQNMDEDKQREQLQLAADLTFPAPTVVCVVLRGDQRFRTTENDNYLDTVRLLGRQLGLDGEEKGQRPPEKAKSPGKNALDNLVLAFTRGDALSLEAQNTFQEDLEKTNDELKQVVKDAKDRWVLLKLPRQQQPDSAPDTSGTTASLSDKASHIDKLLDFIVGIHDEQKEKMKQVSAVQVVLMGGPGTGKSATGNTLLYPASPTFPSGIGLSSIPRGCQTTVNSHVTGWTVKVTDTPAFHKVSDPKKYISDCLPSDSSKDSTPYVLILVLKAWDRFQQQDTLLSVLDKHAGDVFPKRTVVVFTGGDIVSKAKTTMEKLLEEAPNELEKILQLVNRRYVLVDNMTSCDSPTKMLLQRKCLLQAVRSLLQTKKA